MSRHRVQVTVAVVSLGSGRALDHGRTSDAFRDLGLRVRREDGSVIEVPMAEALDKVSAVLTAHGYRPDCARVLAENCLTAQRDGSLSHGLFRLKDYLATIADGTVNGHPSPDVADVAPGFVRVDADNGFAQLALEAARQILVEKARRNGIAILAIRDSHHLGALYLDVEGFAHEGLLALAVVNSGLFAAPPGAHKAVYGTNPLAFAAPRASGPPVVFDQASSSMAHGDLQLAAQQGRQLPETVGIDYGGHPTGDPRAILDGGSLTTFGGHKGASIALMVEVLCAALVGADFSHQLPGQGLTSARTARTGETIIVIDPRAGADDLPQLRDRVDDLVAALQDAGQARIPGDRRIRARHESGESVRIDPSQWAELQELYEASRQPPATA